MSSVKVPVSLGVAIVVTMLASLAGIETTEDSELRDLDVTAWDCANQSEGTAQSQDAKDRNRMKNRWRVNLSLFSVESLDTAGFLKKVREYDARLQSQRRGGLTAAQKDELDRYENQIVSLTGWLVLVYRGPPETTNCASGTFHDWHLEIFAEPSDHAPQIGDPTPIICEITPRGDGKRFVVRADELLAAFLELESAIRPASFRTQLVTKPALATQFAPQRSQAD